MSEALDRNKTELTHTATATAAAWLNGIGCKPIETEVDCGQGWCADLATFWTPTRTEAKRAKILKAMIPEEARKSGLDELEYLYRRVAGRLTIVVEVKVSRADFLRDVGRKIGMTSKPNTLRPPAHFCILAAPASVIGKDAFIDWGVLKLNEDCTRVVNFNGVWRANAPSQGQTEDLIANIAIRRDHSTRYAGLRRWLKSYRLEKAERRKMYEGYEGHKNIPMDVIESIPMDLKGH